MIKRLFAYTQYQFRLNSRYKIDNIFVILSTFIAATIQYYIWQYVEQSLTVQTDTIILYTLFALSFSMVLPIFSSADFVATKVLKGNIIHVLQRPQALFFINLFTQLGNLGYKLLYRMLPLWVMYFLIFKVKLSVVLTVSHVYFVVLSMVLSLVLAFFLGHILGLLSTIFIRTSGIKSFVAGLLLIFGGGLLPIDIYPDFFKTIIMVTPFPAITYYPVAIMSGLNTFDIPFSIGMQCLWIAVFFILFIFVNQITCRHIDIMGG